MMTAPQHLVEEYLRRYPGEAARQMESASPEEVASVIGQASPREAAAVLRHMDPDRGARVIAATERDVARDFVTALDPAVAANLVARLDTDARTRLLEALPPALTKEIEGILSFPAGTAGSLMDPRVTVFRPDTPVKDALDVIRGLRDRRISDLVMADTDGTFEGVVRLQDVVGAEPDASLATLRSPRAITVQPMTPRDEVVELLNTHRLSSLPVVDLQDRVVGIIRHAGLVEAVQEEAVGDLQQMVGGSAEERALSPAMVGVRSRLPWLNINLVTAFLAASVVGLFEDTIARFTAVAVLLPVVAGQSGNTGAQALAVTMRGLSLREFRVSEASRVLVKELIVGFVNGIAIAVVTSIGVYLWSRNLGLSLVMLLAMIVSMIAASAAGAMIPVLLVKLNRDPATASSIILTTVTDVVGFFTFLGLATLLSGMLAS
jgi:magnesium transporter